MILNEKLFFANFYSVKFLNTFHTVHEAKTSEFFFFEWNEIAEFYCHESLSFCFQDLMYFNLVVLISSEFTSLLKQLTYLQYKILNLNAIKQLVALNTFYVVCFSCFVALKGTRMVL